MQYRPKNVKLEIFMDIHRFVVSVFRGVVSLLKKALAIVLMFIASISFAQSDTVPNEYTEVVSVDSLTKDALYNNARSFFVDAFKSAKDVIQYENKEEGKVTGKGILTATGNQNKMLGQSWERKIIASFTIELLTKDGKYKYRIYDITFKSYDQHTSREKAAIESTQTAESLKNESGTMKKASGEAYSNIITNFNSLVVQLKKSMEKKADW